MTLTGAPLQLDRAVVEAARQAGEQDLPAFESACSRLDAIDPVHVRRILEAVLRPVLEDAHPDGVAGDDLGALIERTVRSQGWFTSIDPFALAIVLTGAFGIAIVTREDLTLAASAGDDSGDGAPVDDLDAAPDVSDESVTRHAVVLLAELVPGSALRRRLDHAWQEIERADAQDD